MDSESVALMPAESLDPTGPRTRKTVRRLEKVAEQIECCWLAADCAIAIESAGENRCHHLRQATVAVKPNVSSLSQRIIHSSRRLTTD
jgi:hypothetical protein